LDFDHHKSILALDLLSTKRDVKNDSQERLNLCAY
jgi:hypothetical protein